MRALLERATFGNASIDEQAAKGVIARAEALLAQTHATATS
jgi:hypothetical protein